MGIEKEDDSAANAPRIPERSDSNGVVRSTDDQDAVKQRDSGVSKCSIGSEVPSLPPTKASRQSKLDDQEYSVNTANPPSPVETLERNQYLELSPGAVAVGGQNTEDESNTDINRMDSFSEEEGSKFVTVDLGLVNAEPIEEDLLGGDEEEQRATPEMIAAEPIDDEKVRKTFLESVRDRRFVSIVFCLFLVATALVVGLMLGLRQENVTKTFRFGTNAPTPLPITESPSSSPTMYLEFDPPSPAECRKMANGLPFTNQQGHILRNFEVQLDVSVSRNTVANEFILTSLDIALQRNLAPSLAGCDEVDYQGDGKMLRRRLLRKNVVSGAVFKTTIRDNSESCQPTSPDFCEQVIVTLELYLKGEERIHKLLGLITNAFARESLVDALDLQSPFHSVLFAAIKSTDPTEAPTQVPTFTPSSSPSIGNEAPTQARTLAPSNNDNGETNDDELIWDDGLFNNDLTDDSEGDDVGLFDDTNLATDDSEGDDVGLFDDANLATDDSEGDDVGLFDDANLATDDSEGDDVGLFDDANLATDDSEGDDVGLFDDANLEPTDDSEGDDVWDDDFLDDDDGTDDDMYDDDDDTITPGFNEFFDDDSDDNFNYLTWRDDLF